MGELEIDSEVRRFPLFLFSNRIAYVPRRKISTEDDIIEMKIKLFGGKITDQQSLCNLIIIPYTDPILRKDCMNEVHEK